MKEEGTGGWRKFHNEELYNFYSSLNILVIISIRLGHAEHITLMGDTRNCFGFKFREKYI
jgi:hypothetical protein